MAITSLTIVNQQECGVNDGQITINHDGDTEFRVYNDEFDSGYQSSNIIKGVPPANNYTALAGPSGGPYSSVGAVVEPLPCIISVTVQQQPSGCENEDAVITIEKAENSSGAVEYSLDGVVWQGSSLFSSLSTGDYTARIRNNTTLEVYNTYDFSIESLCINSLDITHSSCGNPGIVTVNATKATEYILEVYNNVTLEFEGGEWQESNVFEGVEAGANKRISIRNEVGTIVNGSFFNIRLVPCFISAITTNSCTNDAGTILATATPTELPGDDVQYSIDGVNYQESGLFEGLVPADYTIYIYSVFYGIVGSTHEVTIDTVVSDIQILSVRQSGNTEVEVIATTSNGTMEYSLDGISWQDSKYIQVPFGATGTVYVRDAAKCQTSGPFEVISELEKTLFINFSRSVVLLSEITNYEHPGYCDYKPKLETGGTINFYIPPSGVTSEEYNVKLVDVEGNIISADPVYSANLIVSGINTHIYGYFPIPTELPEGDYYMILHTVGAVETVNYISNILHILKSKDEYYEGELSLVEYSHKRNTINVLYEEIPDFVNSVYLDVELIEPQNPTEGNEYRTATGRRYSTKTVIDKEQTIETTFFDENAHTAMSIALTHSNFKVNGVLYDTGGGYTREHNLSSRRSGRNTGTAKVYEREFSKKINF